MTKPTKQTFRVYFADLDLAPSSSGDGSRKASLAVEPLNGYGKTDADAIRQIVRDLRLCASKLDELAQEMETN